MRALWILGVLALLAGCSATPSPSSNASGNGMGGMDMSGMGMGEPAHGNVVNMTDTAFEHNADGLTFPVSVPALFSNDGTQTRRVSIHDLQSDKIIATRDVQPQESWSYVFPAAGRYHAFDPEGISDHPAMQVMLKVT